MTRCYIIVVAMICVAFAQALQAQPPEAPAIDDPAWKEVETAMNQGRPQTAIEKLEPIIRQATEAEDYPRAILAIATKIDLQASIHADQPSLRIERMRGEIEAAAEPMKPVMEAILANWMWQFFQQHRWQFAQRTEVAVADVTADADADADADAADEPDKNEADMLTWDLPRILRAVDAQFTRALADKQRLQATPIATYAVLLEKGNAPESYRPTMYDVLAHHALEFYSAGEQLVTLASNAFVLSADSPIFSAREDFLAWNPEATDERSPLLRAVRLYQDLLRFHAEDDDPSARLDVDLLRLEFGDNHAVGEEKTERFAAALRRFEAAHAEHPISARALHRLALIAHAEAKWTQAHELASQGLARFPESVGGKRCYNLVQQIEAKEASATTERVWNAPWPTIEVRYRNVDKVHFRLVRFDFDAFVSSNRWQPEHFDNGEDRPLLRQPVVKAWSADLPATDDYQWRTEAVPVPEDVPAGPYFLIASHREDFAERDNQVSVTEVWVSDLAIVTRNHQRSGQIAGMVLHAGTGEPIAGATVRGWQRGQRDELTAIPPVRTDRDGLFEFSAENRNRVILHVAHGGQQLSTANFLSSRVSRASARTSTQTQFFTDRAIYRPGQSIHYKGICMVVDQQGDRYETMPRTRVSVIFADANGKEIERVSHTTNDYGSFSGSVTAPRDRITGQMTIRVESGPRGHTQVQVEEYKRPRFRVELAAPQEAARLGGPVQLQGTATAYSGAAVDGSAVTWRVVREVRFPPWWTWMRGWWPPIAGERQEIARGAATTTANGTFEIEFTANPDPAVSPDSEPKFHYSVHADVTDSAGETRSATRTIVLGYTALAAELKGEPWLTADKPVELKVRTTTLDGEGQVAEGIVRVHSLKQPESVQRPPLRDRPLHREPFSVLPPEPDPSDPASWELGDVAAESEFKTDGAGNQTLSLDLPVGIYRAVLKSRDRFGKEVTALLPLEVIDPDARRLEVKVPHRVQSEQSSLQPGETFRAVWGSGYPTARALVEIEHRGEIIKRYWTPQGRTQVLIDQQVSEAMRGGFTLHTTTVRENRAYLHSQAIDVPWKNKELSIKWERFTSKLQPDEQAVWTAVITGSDAQRAAAEMVATLYDASLDAFLPHTWPAGFNVFRRDRSLMHRGFENHTKHLSVLRRDWSRDARDGSLVYPRLRLLAEQGHQWFGLSPRRGRGGMGGMGGGMMAERAIASAPMAAADMAAESESTMLGVAKTQAAGQVDSDAAANDAAASDDAAAQALAALDLDNVSARTNLEETAFFFPHAIAAEDGTVRLEFRMPEALTQWKFYGFAHDNQLRGGLLSDTVVTSKELMVQPNAPRFLREGDVLEFTVKVTNQSATRQSGAVRLTFADARSGDAVDDQLENTEREQTFELAAGRSQALAWRIKVPEGLGLLTYRAVGSSGRLSDGEEGYLPVLSRRVLVTESLPLPIRGAQTKQFEFTRLEQASESDSLKHHGLTVQMASNPSWYAVMSLPYLMESPHRCSDQIFNRLYANSLARHIATSDPQIRRVFEQWRGTDALDSPLSKNEDLKALMIEETPWYRDAENESQARRNVGLLFDRNRLEDETSRALHELAQQQLADGRWPWFPGGRGDDFITLYITTGFGRLRHLGVALDTAPAVASLARLDAWMVEIHDRVLKSNKPEEAKKTCHLTPLIAMYLYGRSFFLQDQPLAAEHRPALQFWLAQAKEHWLKLDLQSQARLAIALQRFDDAETPAQILVSLKERAVDDEELGMHWPGRRYLGWWYQAPIATQAMLIEAFDEVGDDQEAVEACKVWLLKQKQTQAWRNARATADAVYALLLRGTSQLASTQLVEVTLGDSTIRPDQVEAGTGFYQQRLGGGEIEPAMSRITVKKSDDGVAWGSVHWQYFENIERITAYEDTPLKLTKELYVKRLTDAGPVLQRVEDAVQVGDELVVRLVLRTDRDLEYVHLKDHRGSGTEPVDVLSRYRFREGLAYYQSTRDAASHFFIDFLPQGTYVFEYSTRVQLRGEYQTGMANIQCMYAPEFGGHSESLAIKVTGPDTGQSD